MSACHTDGRCKFGKNIKRCHNLDRGCKALQISAKSVGLDLLCRDHGKYHNCPCGFCGKICRRASKPDQADQVGYHACSK